jgi:hypothetical protein
MTSIINAYFKTKINENSPNMLHNELIKWPFVLMRILGMYHTRQDKIIFKLYPIICITFLWFIFVRIIQSVIENDYVFGMIFVFKLILVGSLFLVSFNLTLFFYINEMNSKERRLFNHYYDLFDMTKNANKIKKKLSLRLKILYLMIVSESGLNCFITSFILFGPDSLYKTLNGIFNYGILNHSTDAFFYKLFLAFFYTYLMTITFFIYAYFFSHCLILIELLNDFNEQFNELINTKMFTSNKRRKSTVIKDRLNLIDKTIGDKNEFEKYRQWHLKLTDCVWSLDDCFKYFIGILIIVFTLLAYLILYALYDRAEYKLTFKFSVLISFWYILTNCVFFILLFVSARINTLVIKFLFLINQTV